jgi:hypothetical protein
VGLALVFAGLAAVMVVLLSIGAGVVWLIKEFIQNSQF